MNIAKIAATLVTVTLIVIILISGKTILVPFILALFIWFLIKEISIFLKKIGLVKLRVPNWLVTLLSACIIFGSLGFVTRILITSINNLILSYPNYKANVKSVSDEINTLFDIDLGLMIKDYAGDMDFGKIFSVILGSLTDTLGDTVLILIYVIFIFLEEKYFLKKLRLLFYSTESFYAMKEVLLKIERSISRYVGLKTLISFITAMLSYFVLLYIGVESPVFWSFIIFLLNFIPTIGSLVGTAFPALYSILQFGELTPFLLVMGLVGVIQVLVGNVLEPRLMGNTLNISSLVAILSLTFWGALWGIMGMLLSIPVTAMLIIIFSELQPTKGIAIMLSEKGIIE